jgi:hypothetical protein
VAPRVVVPGRIVSIGATLSPQTVAGGTDIEVSSTGFPGMDDLLVLHIGRVDVGVSHYPDPSTTQRLTFTLTPQQFASLRTGDAATVTGGGTLWQLGTLTL